MSSIDALKQRQTQDMEFRLVSHLKTLTWSRDELYQARHLRLIKLLRYAKAHSPWYQRELKNINIETITEENLTDLPTLDKTTLMNNWDEIITEPGITLEDVENHIDKMYVNDQALYFKKKFHIMVTSGSSGRRGVFIYNWKEWNDYYLTFRRYRLYRRNPQKLLSPNRITLALVSSANLIHGIYSLAQTFNSRYTHFFHFPLSRPTSETVSGLNDLQPNVLQGSPFSLYRLALSAINGELNIQPESVNVFAEPFHPEIRKAISTAWPNAEIYNTYGTSEGLTALCCTANQHTMHLNDDMCITEPLDANNQRISLGNTTAKILITNLFNYTLPLIRYQIDDELYFHDRACECGITHQLITEPLSRAELDFTYLNQTVVRSIVFTAALLQDRHIQEYQVIQTLNGVNIKLLSIGPVKKQALAGKLKAKLSQLGLTNPDVNFINVDKFEYPPSGKLKRFIPLTNG